MSDIVFPDFVPNQILTDTQLNQLRDYLEELELETRTRLVGRGIVCGLGVNVSSPGGNARKIAVTSGFGLSSDGDLLELCPAQQFVSYGAYADPDKNDQQQLRYEPWRAAQALYELSTDANFGAPLTADQLAGHVLVLYLERNPVNTDICLVTCDNKGRKIELSVRALLVRKQDLTALAKPPAPLAPYRLPRLHTEVHELSVVSQASELDDAYRKIVSARADEVGKLIHDLFEMSAGGVKLAEFVGLRDVTTFQPQATLKPKLLAASAGQYAYDALKDIVAAYDEALAAAFPLVTECCPTSAFPRHLMLGLLDDLGDVTYRNEFTPAATRNVATGDLERVRGLFARLRWLCENVRFDAAPTAVSVVPSHTEGKALGRRAVPFYFAGVPSWQPLRSGAADGDGPWYEPSLGTTLSDTYASATLLRVEGTIGRSADTVMSELLAARHAGNAEFDVICARTGDPNAQAQQALRDLASALEEKVRLVAKMRDDIDAKVFAGASPDDLNAFFKELGQRLEPLGRRVQGALEHWRAARLGRSLYCDLGGLEADYLETRSEILCCLARTQGALARLRAEVERLRAAGLEELDAYREAALAAFADTLLASLGEPDVRLDVARGVRIRNNVKASARSVDVVDALLLEIGLLESYLGALEATDLPKDVRSFHYGRFQHRFATIERFSIEVWLWFSLLDLPLDGRPAPAPIDEGGSPNEAVHHAPAPAPGGSGNAPLGGGAAPAIAAFAAFNRAEALRLVSSLDWESGQTQGGEGSWSCDEGELPSDGNLPIDPFTRFERELVLGDLLALARCCAAAELGALAARVEQAYANDVTSFQKLAARVDGLEHLAGVPKGGTLVLVCDDVAGKPQVRLDFALEGKLDCCCELEPELCLPPIVRADERVVRIQPDGFGGYESVEFWTDVTPNDREQNIAVDKPERVVTVGLTSRQSSMLAELCVGENMIRYRNFRPRPGVDRFEYTIAYDGECGTTELGHVLVALVAAEVGTVSGTVTRDGKGAAGAQVILRSNDTGVGAGATTDDQGHFVFRAAAPGAYTISAKTTDGLSSETENVSVVARTEAVVNLAIQRPLELGTIVVRLRPPVPNAPIRLFTNQVPLTAITQSDQQGTATFVSMDANHVYSATAIFPDGATVSSPRINLAPNSTLTLIVSHEGPTPSPELTGPVLVQLANDRGVSVRELATQAEAVLGRRVQGLIDPLWDPPPDQQTVFAQASTFVEDAMSSAHTVAELTQRFQALGAAVKTANAPAARDALTAAGLALLDRVGLTTPAALTNETEAAARAVAQGFKSNGIDTNAALQRWNGNQLRTFLDVKSTPAIESVVRAG